MNRNSIWTAACFGLLAGALVPASGEAQTGATKSSAPETLFRIGQPDGLAAEFGLVRETYKAYKRVYPKPIVFTVGQSRLVDWPHIHPSTHDGWAGGKPHTFTIRFRSDKTVGRPMWLSLGFADCYKSPSQVEVAVNGKPLASQRAPAGKGALAGDPASRDTAPTGLAFPIEAGLITAGDNTITITLSDGSWVIYDFLCLASKPRKLEPPDLLADALKGPLADVEDIVFAARQVGKDGHWYANFSYYAEDTQRLTYGEGGKLCRLNLRTGKLTLLVDDPRGGVRDPQVHYDGKKILFSYRKGDSPHYHLYEIHADGTGLRQLTDGDYDDIEPTYLPDGGIVFVSSRCKRWVNCWLTQVAVLYRCDADGGNIREISSNNEHDNTPWPLPDGRILYTRWEYVDRSQVHYHHLWVTNPDGTGQMIYYGNQRPGIVMIDAKPIPGTNKVVSIFSPGHGIREHNGPVTVVDPTAGPDEASFARTLNPARTFRDPYPLSENCFLVAQESNILLMDGLGRTQRIFSLSEEDREAKLQCHEPRPLRPRPRERAIPARSDPGEPTGRLVLANVYEGRNMVGVKPGDIKKLLVLETLPKPINYTGGMEPLSYGGTFTLERIVGTVPVEPDGSAYMEVPALRSLFFVALDENDMSIKRMQSFLTVQPGEVFSCVGCHEQRTRTPIGSNKLMALQRPPSTIQPIEGVPDVFDFPRDIQPILDKHCVACHDYEATQAGGPRAGNVILTGDRGPMYSHSFYTLTVTRQFADGRNRPVSNYAPRAIGSSASPLMKKIAGGHYDAKPGSRERQMIRLWIESGAAYPGTYAALGSGMIGGYAENKIDRSDTEWASTQAAAKVLADRCGRCHTGPLQLPNSPSDNVKMPPWAVGPTDPRLRFSRHILYNLSRPEKSLLLLAPLAREAGGYGICRQKSETAGAASPPTTIFTGKEDPDYQKLLASVQDTANRLNEIKRFDMPDFRPRQAYIREMKRYGILPPDLGRTDPIDVYATDRAYWTSLWYRPARP